MHRYRTIAGVGAADADHRDADLARRSGGTDVIGSDEVHDDDPGDHEDADDARGTRPRPDAALAARDAHLVRATFHGLPVLNGYYARHTDKAGHVTVDDGRRAVPTSLSTAPKGSPRPPRPSTAKTALTAAAATAQATRPLRSGQGQPRPLLSPTTSQRTTLAVLGGAGARLVWQVTGP